MPKPRRRGPRTRRRKVRKNIAVGNAYIKTSFNNTLVTLTDKEGNVIAWASAGASRLQGFAQVDALRGSSDGGEGGAGRHGARASEGGLFVRGPGSGRETAIRSLQAAGLDVTSVKDCTPIPHNGCRPKKRRRV